MELEGTTKLIHMINGLHDVFTSCGQNLDINLPQIAVVGSQSAGKSSVLDGIVGKDFLPRGKGIKTRRPLILQLHHVTNTDGKEWAEFTEEGSDEKKCYENFDDVRKEIESQTDRIAGSNKGISEKAINLKVFSPNVLDLTLVDLPGITKVAVDDQPDDIETLVEELILKVILNPNTIILAVSPANGDIANSDALKLAKKVDPDGHRTIGVITKLDLMDLGTDASDIFQGRICPLKLGYFGVVNRSQNDIEMRKSLTDALNSEAKWFKEDQKAIPYRMLSDRMGITNLESFLHVQLINHIRKKLPGVKSKLEQRKSFTEIKLKEIGHEDDAKNKGKLFHELLSNFNEHLTANVEGKSLMVSITTLKHGANINQNIYGEIYSLIEGAVRNPIQEHISTALENLSGYRCQLYPDQLSFDIFVRQLVEFYRSPLKSSIGIIKSILISAVDESSKDILEGYPKLQEMVLYLVNTNLNKCEQNTLDQLMTFLNAQQAFINIHHPQFRENSSDFDPTTSGSKGGLGNLAGTVLGNVVGQAGGPMAATVVKTVVDSVANSNTNEAKDSVRQQQNHVGNQLESDIKSYMKVVNDSILDMTSKYLVLSMIQATITYCKKRLTGELVEENERPINIAKFMEMGDDIKRKISELLETRKATTKALDIIEKMTTTNDLGTLDENEEKNDDDFESA